MTSHQALRLAQAEAERRGRLLLTSAEVASRCSFSVRTLWRLVKAGKFPQPVKYNRKLVRWKADVVESYIDGLFPGQSVEKGSVRP